ncbi:class I SAM-dependent methyltransferase [Longitalea luteola]|uniref:class I SAM-dependent methyltransferase n=1 Tax=Longitalea luteola TaxID=2812563 RepID=UPI001A95D2BC|nr:class I SAM-dependent methyltransferase [Longitalea luteola]
MTPKNADHFFDIVVKKKFYSSKGNLKFYLNGLFEHVDLSQKEVLDIGGGKGLLSLYAAVKGAKKVVCLEPEEDGSRNGMISGYHDLRRELPESLPVELLPLRLQDYLQQTSAEKYDVVVLNNSINHLDENACIHLRNTEASYRTYVGIFKDLSRIMKPGGVLIATDCSCKNFFNDIHVKNIFVPTIEWHKHQRPSTWISVLKDAGFKNPTVKWPSLNRLRAPGRIFMANPFMSYLTRSYFQLTMEK